MKQLTINGNTIKVGEVYNSRTLYDYVIFDFYTKHTSYKDMMIDHYFIAHRPRTKYGLVNVWFDKIDDDNIRIKEIKARA